MFDTDGKPLVIPNAFETAQAIVAFLQNIASMNWSFAFEPTRKIFEEYAGRQYEIFLYPGEFAAPSYLIFLFTLPVVAALFSAMAFIGLRRSSQRSLAAPEITIIVWFLGHMAMVLLIDPGGIEAWLPSVVPLYIILALRLVEPLSRAGKGWIGWSIVPVLLLHNWFAGIQIFSSAEYNYNEMKAEPVLNLSEPGDLIVIFDAFAFERYLSYTAEVRNIDAKNYDPQTVEDMIEDTLAQGNQVFVFDDLLQAAKIDDGQETSFDLRLARKIADLTDGAKRIDLGQAGFAVVVSSIDE